MLTGKPFVFAAGADIDAVPGRDARARARGQPRRATSSSAASARCRSRRVAAVNGACLGGGVEIALHCDARTISTAVRHFALPGGLPRDHPGLGRHAARAAARRRRDGASSSSSRTRCARTGCSTAPEAFELGFADRAARAGRVRRRVDRLRARARAERRQPAASSRPDRRRRGDPQGARAALDDEVHGAAPAPYVALDLIEGARRLVARGGLPRRGGGDRRAAARAAGAGLALRLRPRRAPGEERRRAVPDAEPRRVRKVGIVGAGLMATQLATLFLRRLEVPVVLRDVERGDRSTRARRRSRTSSPSRSRRAATTRARRASSPRSSPRSTGYDELRRLRPRARGGLRGARRQAAGLRRAARAGRGPTACSRRTRRRSRSTEMGAAPERRACTSSTRSRVLPLVELVRTPSTDDETLATAWDVAEKLRKRAVLVADAPGFVVNRVLTRMTSVADGRARARQHRRGDGRGDPARSACRWRRRCCCRWSARASRTTCSRRCTTPTPTASRSRRRSPNYAEGKDEIVVREQAPRTRRRDPRGGARGASPTRSRHLLEEGVVAEADGRRHVPAARRRLPVLPRRDHEAPRPDRHLGARCSARPLAETSARGRPSAWRRRLADPDRAPHEAEHARALLERLGLDLGSDEAERARARSCEGHRLAGLARRRHDLRLRGDPAPQAEQARAIVEAELARRRASRPRRSTSSTGSPTRTAGTTSRRGETWEEEELERGFAPWEVRVELPSHERGATSSPTSSSSEGYDVVRRWQLPDRRRRAPRRTPTSSRQRVHGEAEPGGEVVWEATPRQPVRHLRRPRRLPARRSAARDSPRDRLCFGSGARPLGCYASAHLFWKSRARRRAARMQEDDRAPDD